MSQESPKRPRGTALREQVMQTALELFSDRGYFNTSIHDIRRAADVSIGAIYHHFGNKEALAKALYDDLLMHMERDIDEACFGRGNCADRCRAIIARLFESTAESPRMMQFVLLAQHREFLRDEPPICSSRPFQAMKQVVEDGIRNGDVRAIEPWVAASAMFGGALRMMQLSLDNALERPLATYLDEVFECGWRAIRS
ncbi:MAG: TetR/AcrR family transcriptional regulator [Gammaproteobacteria bacterium]|nr:TetR/AcrR family transcriptional regulator [Gammaproteobacteria bacterium]